MIEEQFDFDIAPKLILLEGSLTNKVALSQNDTKRVVGQVIQRILSYFHSQPKDCYKDNTYLFSSTYSIQIPLPSIPKTTINTFLR